VFGADFRDLEMLRASFAPIALGVLVGWLLHDARGRERAARVLGARWSAPLVGVLCGALIALLPAEDWGFARGGVQLGFGLLVTACVLREDHGLARVLRLRPLAWVGRVSYGVYLLHMPGLLVARELWAALGVEGPGDLVSAFVAALVLAALSRRFLERPFLRWKQRLRQ
jgi:peptidoglycan/LPS O-acetylase OafA/YrhL